MAEHLTRNEKVVGSIPTISSNNSRISVDIRELLHFLGSFIFCPALYLMLKRGCCAAPYLCGISQNPQPDPHGERLENDAGAPILFLRYPRHDAAYGPGGLVLFLAGGVGVDAEGKSSVVMPQHGGICFHVHTVLQRHCREGVPLWHNKYVQYLGASAVPLTAANRCSSTSSIF